jgi:hypothetical protein
MHGTEDHLPDYAALNEFVCVCLWKSECVPVVTVDHFEFVCVCLWKSECVPVVSVDHFEFVYMCMSMLVFTLV